MSWLGLQFDGCECMQDKDIPLLKIGPSYFNLIGSLLIEKYSYYNIKSSLPLTKVQYIRPWFLISANIQTQSIIRRHKK